MNEESCGLATSSARSRASRLRSMTAAPQGANVETDAAARLDAAQGAPIQQIETYARRALVPPNGDAADGETSHLVALACSAYIWRPAELVRVEGKRRAWPSDQPAPRATCSAKRWRRPRAGRSAKHSRKSIAAPASSPATFSLVTSRGPSE
ncbi:hypothetical protein MPC4_270002 [Methylocella tundrae]|uniref:Uncharacterized protein n=1 Tax=Methylocella tundrae TaxID=227605 RepID=A0A8B6M851_METTU|nr:hypothetical protein MPC4_270002 [Methylocella tundrae]